MNIDVRGLEEVNDVLGQLTRVVKDEGVFTQAGAILLANTKKRFLDQIDPSGSPWPVSYASIQRFAAGWGGGTLFDSGTLFHNIELRKPGPLTRAIYVPDDVHYAAIHQYGLGIHPERAFLGFSTEDVAVIERLVEARLEQVT